MSWLHYLPPRFLPILHALPSDLREHITEFRLRLGKPCSFTAGGRNLFPDENGRLTDWKHATRGTQQDMDELLARLTEGSLYAFADCIGRGYLPLADGCRAGIAGEWIPVQNGMPAQGGQSTFSVITSVNLRVSRFLPDFARPLTDKLREDGRCGVLVVSPPSGGKTTFLRSAAWLLSTGKSPFRVGIADERSELWLPDGISDRITGCPKALAIELLTRSMSPEYLVCDELGAGEENALLAAQNTGVCLLASVHGGSLEEALRRPTVQTLYRAGVFGLAAMLEAGYRVRLEKMEGAG